jgi:CheY-like chemotaxis protein
MVKKRVSNISIDILLIEDNPGDVRLTQEALKESRIQNNLFVVNDGIEALEFLKRSGKKPDLILLDLNLPKMDGREVLRAIKQNTEFKRIPVVVLSTSSAEKDIIESYNGYANCYITKPVDLEQFLSFVKTIEEFWFSMVKLPPQ